MIVLYINVRYPHHANATAFCVYLVLNRDVLGFMVPPALGLLFFYAFTAGAVAIGMFFI